MFGSIDEWFYKSLLGINAASPAFKKITVKPQPQTTADLTWAKGSYQSISGTISSDWKIENKIFSLSVSIPVNTTAEIWVASMENDTVIETSDSTLKRSRFERGYSIFEVGSGSYRFEVR